MPVCSRSGRPLGELAAGFVDGHDGVRPLARIDPDDDHVPVSPSEVHVRQGRADFEAPDFVI
jgi:hypothetical protein